MAWRTRRGAAYRHASHSRKGFQKQKEEKMMFSQYRLQRIVMFAATLVLAMGLIPSPAAAQYQVVNLTSDQKGKAKHVDPNLVNAWGMSYGPGGPFWVSDEGTGLSTVYNGSGAPQSTVVTIPPSSGSGKGTPTGQVYNGTSDFKVTQGSKSGPAYFIFDTLDGTISGWNPTVNSDTAIIAVNNTGAEYTGLAIGTNSGANYIYGADFLNNKVDIYDGSFNFVSSFTDPNVPSGYAPYNVQNIGGQLYVTYTATNLSGGGVVDIFDTAGNLIKTFASGGTLNAPWGIALAPANFGPASKALLVGNLGSGRISAFNAKTGKLIGPLKDTKRKVISISGLWGLEFGGGSSSNGKTNQLFFTAGTNGYADGLFGVINFK
jgi:uncharacterized protein (TIGR03118 family)